MRETGHEPTVEYVHNMRARERNENRRPRDRVEMNGRSVRWFCMMVARSGFVLFMLGCVLAGNAIALQCVRSSVETRFSEAEVIVVGRASHCVATSYASIVHTLSMGSDWKIVINNDRAYQLTIDVIERFKGDSDSYQVLMVPFGPDVLPVCSEGRDLIDERNKYQPWLFYIYRRKNTENSHEPPELRAEAARLNRDKPELFIGSLCSHDRPLGGMNSDNELEDLRTLRGASDRKRLSDSQQRPPPELLAKPKAGPWKTFLLLLEGLGLVIALLDYMGWSKRLQDKIDHYRYGLFFWLISRKHEKLAVKVIQILWFPAFALSVAVVYGLFTGAIWWIDASVLWLGITLAPLLALYVCLPLFYNFLLTINRPPSKTMGFIGLVVALSSFTLQRLSA